MRGISHGLQPPQLHVRPGLMVQISAVTAVPVNLMDLDQFIPTEDLDSKC